MKFFFFILENMALCIYEQIFKNYNRFDLCGGFVMGRALF